MTRRKSGQYFRAEQWKVAYPGWNRLHFLDLIFSRHNKRICIYMSAHTCMGWDFKFFWETFGGQSCFVRLRGQQLEVYRSSVQIRTGLNIFLSMDLAQKKWCPEETCFRSKKPVAYLHCASCAKGRFNPPSADQTRSIRYHSYFNMTVLLSFLLQQLPLLLRFKAWRV